LRGPFYFRRGKLASGAVDRSVVLVDLGYLLAEGGKAYCGAVGRSNSRCDYEKAAIALEDFAVAHAGIPVLRS